MPLCWKGAIDVLWSFVKAFVIGGAICMIGQALVLKTQLTPARILVGYVVGGVLLSAAGLYAPFAAFAGAGATVPLTGFGHLLWQGTKRSIQEIGWMGAFTGGASAASAGITAAIVFGALAALLAKPRPK